MVLFVLAFSAIWWAARATKGTLRLVLEEASWGESLLAGRGVGQRKLAKNKYEINSLLPYILVYTEQTAEATRMLQRALTC